MWAKVLTYFRKTHAAPDHFGRLLVILSAVYHDYLITVDYLFASRTLGNMIIVHVTVFPRAKGPHLP